MKALSIRQPWAWLITHGPKDIENRNWKTNFRGPFLIHTGKEVSPDFNAIKKQCKQDLDIDIPAWQDLPTGGIVGVSRVVDCVTESDSPWKQENSLYGFKLADTEVTEFFELEGRLQFFEVDVHFFCGKCDTVIPDYLVEATIKNGICVKIDCPDCGGHINFSDIDHLEPHNS